MKREAPSYHLVAVAGDLLEGRSEAALLEQLLWVREWAADFPSPLAICSGNHDGNDQNLEMEPSALGSLPPSERGTARRALASGRWMDVLSTPSLATDNRSQVMNTSQGEIVASTIPYTPDPSTGHDALWHRGHLLRTENRCPWLALHHQPPLGSPVGGPDGSTELRRKISEYQPDYVLSGHLHHRPYEGSFVEMVEGAWCFNPGFAKKSRSGQSRPNHIVLDIGEGYASWHSSWEGESDQRVQSRALSLA